MTDTVQVRGYTRKKHKLETAPDPFADQIAANRAARMKSRLETPVIDFVEPVPERKPGLMERAMREVFDQIRRRI